MTQLENRVQAALGENPRTSVWADLMALFRTDREAFYLLACNGAPTDAHEKIRDLAVLAKQVRVAIRESYELVPCDGGANLVSFSGKESFIPMQFVDEVREFLREVDGKTTFPSSGSDYEGEEVSEAEVRFKLDRLGAGTVERERLGNLHRSKPFVLRLDNEELRHIASQPAYVTHELLHCAHRTVLAPTAVYRGLNRGLDAPAKVNEGWAFCGKPRQTYRNDGSAASPPAGMLHVVYADADGFVFDWDWVREDPNQPGHPLDSEIRFAELVATVDEANIDLPRDLVPGTFDSRRACYSSRGDCIFCYITPDESYAERINSDLTAFRQFGTDTYTGFKVKNVRRILQVDQSIVIADAPGLTVAVDSVLLATLTLHPEEKKQVEIYAVLTRALLKEGAEPPKVRVPPPSQLIET